MKSIFIKSALITTIFSAATAFALDEIYVQPREIVCYESYYGNGSRPAPSSYISVPQYCVTPEVISPPTDGCYGETFFRADFLYWKTNENGLNRRVPTQVYDHIDCEGYAVSFRREKNNDPSFDWAPGFRIGLGHRFMDTCWELAAYWTNLDTTANAHLANKGRLHCDLDFNVVDLLASYKFCLVSCFTLKPYFGLRVATVNQSLRSLHQSIQEFQYVPEFHGHNKQKFVGVGPLIGLEGVLSLKYGASIYASAAVAGLYGDYQLNFNNCDQSPDWESHYRLKQHQHSWDAALDFALGIRWEHALRKTFSRCPHNVLLTLDLGLEHHHYFRLNRFNSNQSSSKRRGSDLYFDGFNVAAKLSF